MGATAETLNLTERPPEFNAAAPPFAEVRPETIQAEERESRFSRRHILGMVAGVTAMFGVSEATPSVAIANQQTGTPQAFQVINKQTSFNASVAGEQLSSSDMSGGKVTFLSYVRSNGVSKKYIKRSRCYWDRDGGYNSGVSINSTRRPRRIKDVKWFYDTRDTYVCRVPRSVSPTGLVKAGGQGANGGNCGNYWRDKKHKDMTIIKNRVVMVRNAATAKVGVRANSAVDVRAVCKTADGLAYGYGHGTGTGSAYASVSLRLYAKAKGRGEVTSRAGGSAEADAWSNATGDAKCAAYSSSTTTTETQTTPTCPPGATMPYPKCFPDQEPVNRPPIGTPNPSMHRYVGSGALKECFDDISDPDGDRVDLRDVRFEDENGVLVGGIERGPYRLDPASDKVQCVDWNPGDEPQDKVYMLGTLDDGHGNTPRLKSSYFFQVLERPARSESNA